MKLVAFSIVLDGQPWIEKHLPVFEELSFPHHWIVVEGAAGNTADQAWCKYQESRLSRDGTTAYLESIACHPNVTVIQEPYWPNKTWMVNAAVEEIEEPCVLMEIDADEIWDAPQIELIFDLFDSRPELGSIMFGCRYFVGPDLILQGEHCYGDFDYEWLRAWRFAPGMTFQRHEPPELCQYYGSGAVRMSKEESRKLGLVFDHYAYATEAQVKYKEAFYGYEGLTNQWRALQNHDQFPVSLSEFFAHVKGEWPKVVRI